MSKKKKTSFKTLKTAEKIKNEVSEILLREKIYDSRVNNAFISLHDVKISPDIGYADIYVTYITEDLAPQDLLDYLNSNSKEIRYLLANRIEMRHTPIIRFHHYDVLEKVFKIEELIDNLH